MKQLADRRATITVRYALYGALVGCSVPVVAPWLDLFMQGVPVTGAQILQLQMAHPLHWIMNATPAFLGILGGLVGMWQGRLLQRNAESSTTTALRAEVAEHNREAEVLWESEERFRGAFDYAATGMALVAPDGRWLKVNHALCEIVGYPEH